MSVMFLSVCCVMSEMCAQICENEFCLFIILQSLIYKCQVCFLRKNISFAISRHGGISGNILSGEHNFSQHWGAFIERMPVQTIVFILCASWYINIPAFILPSVNQLFRVAAGAGVSPSRHCDLRWTLTSQTYTWHRPQKMWLVCWLTLFPPMYLFHFLLL